MAGRRGRGTGRHRHDPVPSPGPGRPELRVPGPCAPAARRGVDAEGPGGQAGVLGDAAGRPRGLRAPLRAGADGGAAGDQGLLRPERAHRPPRRRRAVHRPLPLRVPRSGRGPEGDGDPPGARHRGPPGGQGRRRPLPDALMVTAERFAQGLTVGDYVAQMITSREAFARLLAEAPVRPEDREALAGLGRKIKILVITKAWCPDSLRTIPPGARLVDGLPDAELRIFLRDANPDVMDQYLKRGQFRAIPVFAVFDEEMHEVGRMIEAKMNVVSQMRTLLTV